MTEDVRTNKTDITITRTALYALAAISAQIPKNSAAIGLRLCVQMRISVTDVLTATPRWKIHIASSASITLANSAISEKSVLIALIKHKTRRTNGSWSIFANRNTAII